jgi:MSHA biogenesis protein MshP
MKTLTHRTTGFALMLAIFLLVTMAAIGVYLITISSGQVQAVTQDEQGARAYQVARSGIDWGAYQVLINSSCPASTTIPLPQTGLPGVTFYAVVTCGTVGTETEAGVSTTVYQLKSTACNQTPCVSAGTDPGATYVERELSLTLAK